MIIIGKSNKDLGKQLEQLTKAILEKKGYTNCVTNLIGSGGEEIDISAEYPINGLAGTTQYPVICECKAYQDTVSMTQWLKFLGRIYFHEKTDNQEYQGCFIALNGLNGNVTGHYKTLKKVAKNIDVIDKIRLIEIVKEIFNIDDIYTLINKISETIKLDLIEYDLAYYDKKYFYVLYLSSSRYSVITSEGEIVDKNDVVLSYIKNNNIIAGYEYFDILDEKERIEIFKKYLHNVIGELVINTNVSMSSLKSDPAFEKLSEDIITDVLCIADIDERREVLTLRTIDGCLPVDSIRYIIENFFPIPMKQKYLVEFFTSNNIQNSINDDLMNEIETVQGNLMFSDEQKEKILLIICMSPSALHYAVTPDPFIVNHRNKGINNESVNSFDREVFIENILKRLKQDYSGNVMNSLFNEKKLMEIETTTQTRLKSDTAEIFKIITTDRIGIARAADSIGGGLILIRVINDAPEPWERNINQTK